MTIQNYGQVFSDKTENDINYILANVFKFSITGKRLYEIILFLAALGTLSIYVNAKIWKKYLKLVLVSIFMYATYMTGVAFMYLFSMPGGEALSVSGISRYRNTVFIAIYYLLFAFSLELLSTIEEMKKGWIYIAGIFLVLLLVWRGERDGEKFPTVFRNQQLIEPRLHLEQMIEENDLPSGASYMLFAPEESITYIDYIYLLCRYFLWPDNISYRQISEKSQLADAANYEYILLYDEEYPAGQYPVFREWVKENYPEQEGKSVISTAKHNE